ncbi:MAG: hypothetical protein CVU56_22755, partial [Deltaproteobacteria bacterium HGW-Deltaproteobacteria-14]
APRAPDAALAPDDPADAALAPDDPAVAEPPLTVGSPPTAWTPELVPAPVREDAGAGALLTTIAREGLAGHVDPALGLVWAQDGPPEVVAADAVGDLSGPLQVALTSGAEAARCRAGICAVNADGRWFVLVRRTATARLVAGVLHTAKNWPAASAYVSWATQTRQRWQAAGPSVIGGALSLEEGGKYERAFEGFARVWQDDPDNPWPLYYMARVRVSQGRAREAYVSFRRLAEHPAATAVVAQLRVGTDAEMAHFRDHPAVRPVQAELELPAPDAPAAFLAWLQRFRAVPERLATVIAPGGPAPQVVAELLEAHLLDAPEVSASAVRWTGAGLTLKRNALGALEITGASESTSAAPGAAPPR